MHARQLAALVVAIGMLVPVAGAGAAPASDSIAPASADAASASTDAASASADAAAQASPSTAPSNYTRLYVDDRYHHLELKPGETGSFAVVVENGEDGAVAVSPRVVVPQVGERPLEASWVSIDAEDAILDAGEDRTFNVTVSVPDDAELARYRSWIAFTNETIAYPGRPPRPVHATSINVEVYEEPTVRVVAGRHAYTQIQAGETFTHEIVVENTGDRPVPVSPELATERRHRRYPPGSTVERSWFEIDAPNEVEPGETATVTVTITPPSGADRGRYDAELDLGIRDPARPERDAYWQRIDLDFQVWKQPDEPFETTFAVNEDATAATLTLSADGPHYRDTAGTDEPPSFDVAFVHPNGTVVAAERVEVTDTGHVDLSGDDRRTAGDGAYASSGGRTEFVYRLDDPASGTWTARIMPHNAVRFGYEIVRHEADD